MCSVRFNAQFLLLIFIIFGSISAKLQLPSAQTNQQNTLFIDREHDTSPDGTRRQHGTAPDGTRRQHDTVQDGTHRQHDTATDGTRRQHDTAEDGTHRYHDTATDGTRRQHDTAPDSTRRQHDTAPDDPVHQYVPEDKSPVGVAVETSLDFQLPKHLLKIMLGFAIIIAALVIFLLVCCLYLENSRIRNWVDRMRLEYCCCEYCRPRPPFHARNGELLNDEEPAQQAPPPPAAGQQAPPPPAAMPPPPAAGHQQAPPPTARGDEQALSPEAGDQSVPPPTAGHQQTPPPSVTGYEQVAPLPALEHPTPPAAGHQAHPHDHAADLDALPAPTDNQPQDAASGVHNIQPADQPPDLALPAPAAGGHVTTVDQQAAPNDTHDIQSSQSAEGRSSRHTDA